MIVLNCRKFTEMLVSVNLVQILDSKVCFDWCQYITAKIFGLLAGKATESNGQFLNGPDGDDKISAD